MKQLEEANEVAVMKTNEFNRPENKREENKIVKN